MKIVFYTPWKKNHSSWTFSCLFYLKDLSKVSQISFMIIQARHQHLLSHLITKSLTLGNLPYIRGEGSERRYRVGLALIKTIHCTVQHEAPWLSTERYDKDQIKHVIRLMRHITGTCRETKCASDRGTLSWINRVLIKARFIFIFWRQKD